MWPNLTRKKENLNTTHLVNVVGMGWVLKIQTTGWAAPSLKVRAQAEPCPFENVMQYLEDEPLINFLDPFTKSWAQALDLL